MNEFTVPDGAVIARPEEYAEARALRLEWIRNAHKAVKGAFPDVDWTRTSPEIEKDQENLDWYLWAHFYSKTATISDVRDAWRRFYQLHLPGQSP